MQETELLEALAAPKDYRIRIAEGPDAVRTVSSTDALVIGTSEHCDVRLTDRAVSRRHCVIEATAGGVSARDADSKNGTWLGGARLERGNLPTGARLTIGRTVVVVEEEDAGERPTKEREPPRDHFGAFLGSARALQLSCA